jgi:hypothetical protein
MPGAGRVKCASLLVFLMGVLVHRGETGWFFVVKLWRVVAFWMVVSRREKNADFLNFIFGISVEISG